MGFDTWNVIIDPTL
jgi:hypothetical protein